MDYRAMFSDRRKPLHAIFRKFCDSEQSESGFVRRFSSPFSLSTFPVCRLRLRSMKEKTGRAEDRMASDTAFHMIFAQLNPAVRAFLAGGS